MHFLPRKVLLPFVCFWVAIGLSSSVYADDFSEREDFEWEWGESFNYRSRILPLGTWSFKGVGESRKASTDTSPTIIGLMEVKNGVSRGWEIFSNYRLNVSESGAMGSVRVETRPRVT